MHLLRKGYNLTNWLIKMIVVEQVQGKKTRRVRLGSRRQPDASRRALLKAASAEFADHGLAGARVDAIAETAGVNKALLYYYFHDKETLYGAVIDDFFARLQARVMSVFDSPDPAGERVLRYVREHFNCIAESPHYARLFLGELLNAGRGGSPHITRMVEQYARPISARIFDLLQEGIHSGEFRAMDVEQVAPTIIATIVFYFAAAPVISKLRNVDPLTSRAIHERRAAVLDFIAAALFSDRGKGTRLAAQIEGENGMSANVRQTAIRDARSKHK